MALYSAHASQIYQPSISIPGFIHATSLMFHCPISFGSITTKMASMNVLRQAFLSENVSIAGSCCEESLEESPRLIASGLSLGGSRVALLRRCFSRSQMKLSSELCVCKAAFSKGLSMLGREDESRFLVVWISKDVDLLWLSFVSDLRCRCTLDSLCH